MMKRKTFDAAKSVVGMIRESLGAKTRYSGCGCVCDCDCDGVSLMLWVCCVGAGKVSYELEGPIEPVIESGRVNWEDFSPQEKKGWFRRDR